MFHPQPMKHVRLLLMADDLPRAALALAETECFHPDPRPPEEQVLSDQPGRDYNATYQQARARLDKIARTVPVAATPEFADVHVVDAEELAATNALLRDCREQVAGFEEGFHRIDEEERSVRDQAAALANFADLGIDLGTLRNKTRFLDFHVGMVPRANVARLEGAVRLADCLLFNELQRGDSALVIIVGPNGETESRLASVLAAAGFQALPIPAGLDDAGAAQKRAELSRRAEELQRERTGLRDELARWEGKHRDLLLDARRSLLLAEPLVVLDPSVHSHGQLAMLAGWVPARTLERLQQRLRETVRLPFQLDARDPLPAERPLVPSVPPRNRWLEPFAVLVRQYGIPRYGEVDPTPLFAFTFLLMFGSMFGDVGQGGVIAALAWAFRAKLGRMFPFGIMAGLSSVLFGFLYGSIFGYEDILPAVWRSPIHHPILMLEVALGYGVVFLVVACLLAIYNRLAVKNAIGALFGHHGVVNLIFYLALVWGGLNLGRNGALGSTPLLLAFTALGALAWYGWRGLDGSFGEKLLASAIQTLETVIGYVSSTLSFLRVAAFSLNHAALSIAVLTLAGMLGQPGHLLAVILGNVFVLVLEGCIVMIQVLRLEFYEGFSRYFTGDGHAFAPLRLRRPRPVAMSPSASVPASRAHQRQAAR